MKSIINAAIYNFLSRLPLYDLNRAIPNRIKKIIDGQKNIVIISMATSVVIP